MAQLRHQVPPHQVLPGQRPRVAIAHDYLTQRGGAERVVLAMARAFPDAQIHTLLYDAQRTYPEFADLDVLPSALNRCGPLRRNHRLAFPLLAPAASLTEIDAEVVLTSSSGWAHGFRTTGASIVYCHTPPRWLHANAHYLGDHTHLGARMVMSALRLPLKPWDARAAERCDRYLANSHVVRDRIRTIYDRDAEVVPPAYGIDPDGEARPLPEVADWPNYYLLVSRLMPHKNVDVAIEAFRGSDHRLLIIGDGPMRRRLSAIAPPNVRIVSEVEDAQLRWVYAAATALLAPAFEDFGLTPVEAANFAVPTIALRSGGYLDTVLEGTTGVFMETLSPQALHDAVRRCARWNWQPQVLREHARTFNESRFAAAMHRIVNNVLSERQAVIHST